MLPQKELYRVVGPPGCGKTTYVARQVEHAAQNHSVLVCSLTNAAANEAAARVDVGVVGTLHSHCYAAIGRPKILKVKGWNEEYPAWELSADAEGVKDGDAYRRVYDLARHRMEDVGGLGEDVQAFVREYEGWKAEHEVIDFTDMIERALHEAPYAPGSPDVIFADEAQDLSILETAVLVRWGRDCETVILVGDPAQALFAWRGSSESYSAAEPDLVLSQSYRVPAMIQDTALGIIRRSSTYREAEYLPMDSDGEVVLDVPWQDMDLVGTMFLAPCAYQLEPIIRALRDAGIPYHNPYSDRFNPLSRGSKKRGTAVDRLLAFLCIDSKRDVELLLGCIKARWIVGTKKGATAELGELPDDDAVGLVRFIKSRLDPELAQLPVRAFAGECLSAYQAALEYPIAVYEHGGEDALTAKPTTIVGTIHSVKGGEAESVWVDTTLSAAGMDDYETPGWAHHDGIMRMYYVAATRARRQLTLGTGGVI